MPPSRVPWPESSTEPKRERTPEERLRRLRLLTYGVGALILFFALMALVFGIIQAAPADPVKVYDSHLGTDLACPTEGIPVITDIEMISSDVEKIEYESNWQELGNALNTRPGGTFEITDNDPYKRQQIVSPFIRTAPLQSGEWTLTTSVDVYYDWAGFPRHETLEFASTGVLEVVPLSSERCQN